MMFMVVSSPRDSVQDRGEIVYAPISDRAWNRSTRSFTRMHATFPRRTFFKSVRVVIRRNCATSGGVRTASKSILVGGDLLRFRSNMRPH
jgi:hypothetical protein